jgi:PAS domain S-box-containing protein
MQRLSFHEIETILNSTHDGMIAVDGNCVVTLFNRSAERITGLLSANVLGRKVHDVIPTTRLPNVLRSGKEELNRQQIIGDTVIITNRVPLRNDAGEIIGAAAVFRDVTELRALAEQVSGLGSARSLLEAVIESTADAISVADEQGNTIIVNPAYSRITGLPPKAVLNKPVTADIAEGESMHLRVLRTGQAVRNVRMKVGPARKEVIVNVAPIVIEGSIRGSVGVIHDISEIMTLNEELAATRKLLRRLRADYTWEDIVGESTALVEARETAKRAAGTPATVLLRGESGTGKELFAHAIHNASRRSGGQFVRVNCAALPEQLLESELFGYEEGAFTGASRGGKRGLFEEADRGTIFLDEVGEISQTVQTKLLRVLQDKEIRKVGGTSPIAVDVRVIAATNADLEQKIREKTFREDLYYRLNVLPIRIPALRYVISDLPAIATHLIRKLNQSYGREVDRIAPSAIEVLRSYNWPGNVRELESVLSRSMIAMRPHDKIIETIHLPVLDEQRLDRTESGSTKDPLPTLNKAIAQAEKHAIERALQESGGNREKAAKALGTAVRNLYYKIKRYRITG